jgi:hypothetical protein
VRRALAGAALAALTAGCATAGHPPRDEVIRAILASTVQLRIERASGERASGSGVVVRWDPAGERAWILTARHVLGAPGARPKVTVAVGGGRGRLRGEVTAVSEPDDLALVEVRGAVLPAVSVQEVVGLGQEVWVVGFPWGRRLTLVSGVVSQLALEDDDPAIQGPARMVDASVSYGVSGGGVFDAATGALVAIVEGYRTARVTLRNTSEPAFDLPVAGETTVVSARAILAFLEAQGIAPRRAVD